MIEQRGKILVVDDSAMIRKMMAETLRRAGYDVATADDGLAALTAVAAAPPDLITLDMEMPRLTGFETLEKLKGPAYRRYYYYHRHPEGIPVIFIAGNEHLSDRKKGFELGAVDFIVKPFVPEELLARIRGHLAALWLERCRSSMAEQYSEVQHLKDRLVRRCLAQAAGLLDRAADLPGLPQCPEDNRSHGPPSRSEKPEEPDTQPLENLREQFRMLSQDIRTLSRITPPSRSISPLSGDIGQTDGSIKLGVEDDSGDGTDRALLDKIAARYDTTEMPGTDHLREGCATDPDQPEKKKTSGEISAGEPIPDPLAGITLLAAEDNRVNQKLLERTAQKIGVDLVIVSDGRMAVEAIEADPGRFDAVLMDVEMPVMDGRQAAQEIRSAGHGGVPILAMTAHTSDEERQRCLASGMNDFVPKPLRKEDLLAALKRWVRSEPAT